MQARLPLWFTALCLAVSAGSAADPSQNSEGLDFFEKKIRPLLAEHCYQCHSAASEKGPKAGLRLDLPARWTQGGESGPAIVPGDLEKSLLIKAVRYEDENLRMPPKNKKLSSEQIADLEAWIKMGAPAPQGSAAELAGAKTSTTHWAFQPVRRPEVPTVRNASWVKSPIDAFILAKLEAKALAPSPPADWRTLLRRASFDLTGLPPAASEVAAFLEHPSFDAYAKWVDRLLSSPRFGEKWARHWLDVARYADTKGYVFEEERRFPYSYTYRDYVIRAFNEDLPYDRFLVEQIAADLLPLGEDKRPLAALGFLTLGRRFLNNQHDIIDDRIDVVTRGTMALTVTCARCHDHKFDPIPTADYYSLYGVLASSSEPAEKPLLGLGTAPSGYGDYLKERAKRNAELEDFRQTKEREALAEVRRRTGEYLLTAWEASRMGDSSKAEGLARQRKLHPATVERWKTLLEDLGKEPGHPVLAPWFAFGKLETNQFPELAPKISLALAVDSTNRPALNPLVALAFAGEPPESMQAVADRYGKLFAEIHERWQALRKTQQSVQAPADGAQASELKGFADPHLEAIRQLIDGPDSPANVPEGEIVRLFDVPTAQKVRALRRKLEELDATHPGAPPRAMALRENSNLRKPRVFLRGNPRNPGPEVPRQFLALLAGENRRPFEHGSGRLEMAEAIASERNPLTARVLVNRIWLQHFGTGLVRTPSDFGLRCDPPSHPELLDYLAAEFMAEGWSLKKLHRSIVLSSVYQQSSEHRADGAAADPANDLLWRMNRRRLDLESMRDSLLAVAGKLDLTMGGRPVELTSAPFTSRRTVYGFIERQNLPGLFRTFDFASPDTTSPQRFATTVPQQALFMINSPFVAEQAREFAHRPEVTSAEESTPRIRALYQTAFQRDPAPEETELGLAFIASAGESKTDLEPSAWQYGYGEYDASDKRLRGFSLLPHFSGESWQGGPKLPDAKLGWVTLSAVGGHPGLGEKFAAVRRWTAPSDAAIRIRGQLGHAAEKGDGIRGLIVSSRDGELGAWTVHAGNRDTTIDRLEVRRGDTVDFIVECRETIEFDSFTWAPELERVAGSAASEGNSSRWHAKEDFKGPQETRSPLNRWEKYAQVLLMSNELVFVD